MTVSRVINESHGVRADTRRRVKASISTLGYVPNRLARGLIQRRTGIVAMIVPDIANPLFARVTRGVEEVAWRAGYQVMLCDTKGDLEREAGYVEEMLAFRVEGALIAPVGDRSRAHIGLLKRNDVPVVLIDRAIDGFESDLVQGDSISGARQLTEYLVGLGHVRIGMVTESDEVSTARDRKKGYREALEKAGIAFDPQLVAGAVSSPIDPLVVRESTLELLDLSDAPTAIFAVNNIAVVGVMEAARERGLEIPEELALVCFHDIEYVSQLYPFLTVIAQPAETYGALAAQLILDRLHGRVDTRRRIVVLPPDFIVRKSSGAPTSEPA